MKWRTQSGPLGQSCSAVVLKGEGLGNLHLEVISETSTLEMEAYWFADAGTLDEEIVKSKFLGQSSDFNEKIFSKSTADAALKVEILKCRCGTFCISTIFSSI